MKKLMNFLKVAIVPILFLAFIMLAHQASAQGKHSDAWKGKLVQNLKDNVAVADEAQAEAMLNQVLKMKPEDKSKWQRDNTVVISGIPVVYAQLGVMVQNQVRLVSIDTVKLNIRFLRLEKALGAQYVGELFPMYAFKGKDDANQYNPDLIYGFDLDGDLADDGFVYDEATKKHSPVYGVPPVAQNQTVNQQGTAQNSQGSNLGAVQYYVQGPNGLVPVYAASSAPQNSGAQGIGGGNTATNTKTATLSQSMTISQSGDSSLLANSGSFGQVGQTKSVSKDPDEVEFWNQDRLRADGTTVEYERGSETGGEWRKYRESKPDVIEAMTLKPNQVLINKTTGEVLKDERKRESRKVRRLYDLEEDAPSEGSARAVEAMNGGGSVGWAPIGMTWGVGGWVGGGGCNNGINMPRRRAMDGNCNNGRAFRPVFTGSSLGGL